MPIRATALAVAGHDRPEWADSNVAKVNNIIMADRCVPVRELSLQLDIGEASVGRIIKQLGYAKVCANVVHLFNIDIRLC